MGRMYQNPYKICCSDTDQRIKKGTQPQITDFFQQPVQPGRIFYQKGRKKSGSSHHVEDDKGVLKERRAEKRVAYGHPAEHPAKYINADKKVDGSK